MGYARYTSIWDRQEGALGEANGKRGKKLKVLRKGDEPNDR